MGKAFMRSAACDTSDAPAHLLARMGSFLVLGLNCPVPSIQL